MSAVVIAAPNLLPHLRDRLAGEPGLLTFADSEPIQALQAILETKPRLIVLERLFAATPRGAALINRIKNDPLLAGSEVQVVSHTGDYVRQVVPGAASSTVSPDAQAVPLSPARMPEDAPRPLDWHGTRRAPRYAVRAGVEIQLDGNIAALLDVSGLGAQVLSATILRPNQKVRVSLALEDRLLRCRGAIAWAKFELPNPTAPPVYRAGVEFLDADAHALDLFIARHAVADPRRR